MFDDFMGRAGGKRNAPAMLARFTRDLTAEAAAGRLEPVRCRAPEIDRVIDILLRHGKNNPALVGPAGVGKTAIAEGLAQRMSDGGVPLALRGTRVLAVDHVALLAGTTYRGQYEERIQGIVDATTASDNIVLFIDELHNLIGQGSAMGTAMDAANMLKPALVRGDFRVIGATTDEEYERYVAGDPALERRFQRVNVRELSADETMEVLRARRQRLERHHNVVIADEALIAALQLTDTYVTDRRRPDRALDALDEACAHSQALATHAPVTEDLIVERKSLLKARELRAADAEKEAARESARTAARDAERSAGVDANDARGSASSAGSPSEEPVDRLERFARDGVAAIERFGAELEAIFVGPGAANEPTPADAPPPGGEENGARAANATSPGSGASTDTSESQRRTSEPSLAVLETELTRRLIEEGSVVRGLDVARVVAVATGRSVTWSM
jgi:ATP-dependent Clp protease ATP-binding subunit ClpA